VIRALTETLLRNYGAKKVWGVPFGYKGLLSQSPELGGVAGCATPWKELTRDAVFSIHKRGGSILGSSRGFRPDEHIDEVCV